MLVIAGPERFTSLSSVKRIQSLGQMISSHTGVPLRVLMSTTYYCQRSGFRRQTYGSQDLSYAFHHTDVENTAVCTYSYSEHLYSAYKLT